MTPAQRDDPADDTAAARRVLLLAVAAVATAVGAAIVLLVGGGDEAVEAIGGGAEQVVASIGPPPGVDVATYEASRRAARNTLDGRAVAVVSFVEYVPAAEVEGLVGDDVEVRALLVALPGGPPATTTDPAAFRRNAVTDAQDQIAEITGLLPTVDDEEFVAFYRAELDRYGATVAASDRADIVFGAVVLATGPELRALASRDHIRLVDAVGGTALADGAPVTGLRPEETARTGTPEFRPS